MKHLHVNTKVLTFILFFLILLPSCNNEEIFIVEESAIIAEETTPTEEDTPNNEDTAPPIDAVDDAVITMQNVPVDIEAYLNDTNLPASITLSNTNPSNGVLTINNNDTPDNFIDDTVVYTPNAGFSGNDSFEYTVCDALDSNNCDTAMVVITVEENTTGIEDEFSTELKAFPSAYGGGAYATGGRGGTVYHVTNLAGDASTGSFRWALNQPRPAIIVFDVSGTIDLLSTTNISGQDLTIAGQTAPIGGITITSSNGSRFKGQACNNIIIRYIRIRPFESGNDAFEFYGSSSGAYNIIMDHVSASYGGDETVSLRGVLTHNVTYQRMLIADSKTGSLFGDSDVSANSWDNSFLNSLFWNVSHRHPNTSSDSRVDIINNVIQNHQYRLTTLRGDIQLNHINNYYAMGGRTSLEGGGSQKELNTIIDPNNDSAQIYTAGNIADKGQFTDPLADNRVLWVNLDGGAQTTYADASNFTSTQYTLIGAPMPIQTATEAYTDVIADVGANASLNADGTISTYLDANDTAYINIMNGGEGSYEAYTMESSIRSWFDEQRYADFVASVSSTPINTRPAGYDTDNDGMADIWENMYGTNPNLADNNGDKDGDGFTNLEEFLNSVDKN